MHSLPTLSKRGPFEGEADWKLSFRQEGTKLAESLHKAVQEHLQQQELFISGLLEKAQQLQCSEGPSAAHSANPSAAPSGRPSVVSAAATAAAAAAVAPEEVHSGFKKSRSNFDRSPNAGDGGESPGAVAFFSLHSGSKKTRHTDEDAAHSFFGLRSASKLRMPTRPDDLKQYMDSEMRDLTMGMGVWGNSTSSPAHDEKPRPGLFSCLAQLQQLQEPIRMGRLARIVTSPHFEVVTFLVIACYGVFAMWMTDTLLAHPDVLEWPAIVWTESLFLVFFVAELVAKLAVHRFFFFWNADTGWNLLDFLIIVFSLVDVAGNAFIPDGHDVNFMRVVRALRITKGLRMIRAVRFVSELRLLVNCIVTSFSALFWCVVLLLFIQGGVSTALVQLVASYVNELRQQGAVEASAVAVEAAQESSCVQDANENQVARLVHHFGSVQASMMSLSMSTTGGADWGDHYELISQTGQLARLVYVAYLLFFFVAAWNIITSLFIERAMNLSRPDLETLMLSKHREDLKDADEIIKILEHMDVDERGTISLQQFKQYMRIPRFRNFFELRDLEIRDAELFFRMLAAASDSEDVPYDTFAYGCMRMKGYASSLDVQTLRIELKTMYCNQAHFFRLMSDELTRMKRQVPETAAPPKAEDESQVPLTGQLAL